MRILHTSDWHLGLTLCGASMIGQQREMADFLLRTVREQGIDAVLIAGDIFDHAVSTPEALKLYNDTMTALCSDIQVPVLLCAGNHDGAARLSTCAALLARSGLYISGSLGASLEPVVIGDAAFFLLPYFGAEQVRACWPQANVRGAGDAMAYVTQHMRLDPNRKNILIAHCFAAGGQTGESDRAAVVGGASCVPLQAFDRFDYVALGHLHRAQQPTPHIRYSGSPLCYAFSESENVPSFTIVQTPSMEITTVPVRTSRSLRVLKSALDDLLFQFSAATDDYLKIELTDAPAGAETFAILRERFPGLLALTGIVPVMGESAGSLTVDELFSLTPHALLERFCTEISGASPTTRQRAWFSKALYALSQEGESPQ